MFVPSSPELRGWRAKPMREVKRYVDGNVLVVETERGYPWQQQLDQQGGPFLELAGPTDHFRRDIIDFSKYREKTKCTNIELKPGVDEVADATRMRFPDQSFQAVFISSFRITDKTRQRPKPEDKIDLENAQHLTEVAKEAWRVLAPGGLLVWLRLETEAELKSIESLGFIPVFSQDTFFPKASAGDHERHRYQVVYVKE